MVLHYILEISTTHHFTLIVVYLGIYVYQQNSTTVPLSPAVYLYISSCVLFSHECSSYSILYSDAVMCVCLCVFLCVCLCVYMCTHVNICVCECVCGRTCVGVGVNVCVVFVEGFALVCCLCICV